MSQWHQIKSYLVEVFKSAQILTEVHDISNYQFLIEPRLEVKFY